MNRRGFALLLVLVAVAALQLIGLAIITLTTHEAAALGAQQQNTVAARAASAALHRIIRAWPVAAIDSLRVAQAVALSDSAGVIVQVTRHTAGQFRVVAAAPAGRSWIRQGALLETLDTERAHAEAGAVVVATAPILLSGARFHADTTTCPPGPPSSPVDSLATLTPGYAFGGLDWDELSSVADSGLVFADTAVVLLPGTFSGVLATRGDLVLRSGARFDGVAVVGGGLLVEDGVHITGSIIVRGSGPVTVGAADLTHSPCVVRQALAATAATRRLARTQRRFIPVF